MIRFTTVFIILLLSFYLWFAWYISGSWQLFVVAVSGALIINILWANAEWDYREHQWKLRWLSRNNQEW